MSVLSQPQFHDEAKAFAFLESVIWADGVVCPHCGVIDGRVYDLSEVRGSKSVKNPEGAIRHGLKKCGECRKQFTVKVGTVFEHARMPLHKMLQAVHLIVSSKKGISAHQLHRTLEVQYKSAWFLAHRIREAMRDGMLGPLGGLGVTVEVDETFIGREPGTEVRQAYHHKMKVLTLVERRAGVKQPRARSFVVDGVGEATIMPIVLENIARESAIMTDEGIQYRHTARYFRTHDKVSHSAGEYVRGNVHTNTIEGYFSIFKRGMRGTYQHCSKKHLHRYLAEFDFRYSNRIAVGIDDTQRSLNAIEGIVGKRLTYAAPSQREA
jgi:transposase-like protein